MAFSLPVVNLTTATFECIFGRGCDGLCCQNGRPSISEETDKLIRKVLPRTLPHMRPEAQKLVESEGFTSKRVKVGQPMLRVVDGWCVFFNKGCVLHTIGIEDGDSYKYKPLQCALFPLEQEKDEYYIRQWGFKGEVWDLFCLNPKATRVLAAESLEQEIKLAEKVEKKKKRGAKAT